MMIVNLEKKVTQREFTTVPHETGRRTKQRKRTEGILNVVTVAKLTSSTIKSRKWEKFWQYYQITDKNSFFKFKINMGYKQK